ncbi:hypothetical protein AVEN_235396-1 [Araneus ventricosus]|uniref:Uncharacterized protein n=1 Tax=Araneus ventricosus TaxID=182803 RepID=A0A4Y2A4V4_ARAVE|nr:hypothetical protein AVEN_235396-1 [Araneus ventricosus]
MTPNFFLDFEDREVEFAENKSTSKVTNKGNFSTLGKETVIYLDHPESAGTDGKRWETAPRPRSPSCGAAHTTTTAAVSLGDVWPSRLWCRSCSQGLPSVPAPEKVPGKVAFPQ